MKELLSEIDELLTHLENYIHGKDGNDITEMRYKIRQALRQPDVIKSACDAAIMPKCTDTMNIGYCDRCGKDIKQTVL